MPDTNLHVTRSQLLDMIGEEEGYGPQYSDWSGHATDVLRAQRWVDGGLNMFYVPPPIPGERSPHAWSFLHPEKDIEFSPGVQSYTLPDDFGGFEPGTTQVFFRSSSTTIGCPLALVSITKIRAMRSGGDTEGQPTMAAHVVMGSDGEEPQRHALEVWPTPSVSGVCVVPFYSNPYQLTSDKPYPLGGQPHANAIKAAVRAYMELDREKLVNGPRYAQFMLALTSSVWHDRKLIQSAKQFGLNVDHSRGVVGTRRNGFLVTYEPQD